MSATTFDFSGTQIPASADAIREDIRAFMREERERGRIAPADRIGMAFDAAFSRRCGERGYIGMTWPKRYGGQERTPIERFVATEEFLVAGAPVRGHWTSDRQSGPVILRYGTDEQKDRYLPPIAAGESFFCIGLSEPDSGSDLASVRCRADTLDNGSWRLNGTKVWTTNAHNCHYMIALCRSLPQDPEARYHGLSQFIVDLTLPGVTVRPVENMAGENDFNEVIFEDVELAPDAILGTPHEGWKQVSAELAYERSGPERWLSAYRLLAAFNAIHGASLTPAHARTLGQLLARMVTLREMSLSIAGMLQAGATPNLEASMVKDIGTLHDREIIRAVRDMDEELGGSEALRPILEHALLMAPAFTIRGGTTEILRGTIARGLRLR